MAAAERPRCAVCGKAVVPEHRPFCSARCRQVDLGRWLSGDYVIAGDPVEADSEPEPRR